MRMPDREFTPGHPPAGEPTVRPRRVAARWVLLAGFVFVLALPVLNMLRPENPERLLPNVLPLLFLLMLGSTMSPFNRGAFMTERGLTVFDEFERAAILKATRLAYFVGLVLVALTFTWLTVGARLGWPLPHLSSQWAAIGFALFVAMAMMPVLFAEFTVPMPVPEDQP